MLKPPSNSTSKKFQKKAEAGSRAELPCNQPLVFGCWYLVFGSYISGSQLDPPTTCLDSVEFTPKII